MDTNKVFSILSVTLAVISAAIGFLYKDGIAATTSLIALGLSIVSMKYTQQYSKLALVSSLVVILCTASITTFMSYDSQVVNGNMSQYLWPYLSAIVYSVSIMPLIFLFYLVSAYVFKASYNWVIVGGFTTFIGMGMIVPGYAMIYLISSSIDDGSITISSTSIGIFVNLLCFLAVALVAGYMFKKRKYMITENGIGGMF